MRTATAFTGIILLAAIGLGAWIMMHPAAAPSAPVTAAPQPIATVNYLCNDNKSITASLYAGTSTPPAAPGQPPQPGGSAHVVLSDGRTMDLKQTISADGIRYSNGDPQREGSETFVFWSKGNGALVLENNQDQTYVGCVKVVGNPGDLPQAFASGSDGFSIRYPAGFGVDSQYVYQELGPGKQIYGVKFTIASSTAAGTNLGSDTYLSVEQISAASSSAVAQGTCDASLFLDKGGMMSPATTTTEGDVTYSVASSTGAGAGNRYEEWVWALPGTHPCVAVRYFIHYGVFQNYPPGTVKQFDEGALLQQFDEMRRTLTIAQ